MKPFTSNRNQTFDMHESNEQLHARIADLKQRLRESEELYRQVTDTIDEVFWMTDPVKNNQLFISSAYEQIWGRSCKSLLDNPMTFLDAIHPEDRDAVIAALPSQAKGNYDIEYRIVRPDGGLRWIRDKAFPLTNPAGEIYRVVGVAQDITENKTLLHDLQLEQARSERLLENILPRSIINTLKAKDDTAPEASSSPVVAQRIELASVLFADLVGFTAFSGSR